LNENNINVKVISSKFMKGTKQEVMHRKLIDPGIDYTLPPYTPNKAALEKAAKVGEVSGYFAQTIIMVLYLFTSSAIGIVGIDVA